MTVSARWSNQDGAALSVVTRHIDGVIPRGRVRVLPDGVVTQTHARRDDSLNQCLGSGVGARARTDRAVGLGWPTLYLSDQRLTVGHEHWNWAAASQTGKHSSTTKRATVKRVRRVRAAFA